MNNRTYIFELNVKKDNERIIFVCKTLKKGVGECLNIAESRNIKVLYKNRLRTIIEAIQLFQDKEFAIGENCILSVREAQIITKGEYHEN